MSGHALALWTDKTNSLTVTVEVTEEEVVKMMVVLMVAVMMVVVMVMVMAAVKGRRGGGDDLHVGTDRCFDSGKEKKKVCHDPTTCALPCQQAFKRGPMSRTQLAS
jgi:hypothetical protein